MKYKFSKWLLKIKCIAIFGQQLVCTYNTDKSWQSGLFAYTTALYNNGTIKSIILSCLFFTDKKAT